MKIATYLHSGPSSRKPLEALADGLNFLGRRAFMSIRVEYDNKTNQFVGKKNIFFTKEEIQDRYGGSTSSGAGVFVVSLAHLLTIPFALVGACLGIPLKKFCLSKNLQSKTYNIAKSAFAAQEHAKRQWEEKTIPQGLNPPGWKGCDQKYIDRLRDELSALLSIRNAGYKQRSIIQNEVVENPVDRNRIDQQIVNLEKNIQRRQEPIDKAGRVHAETIEKATKAWNTWLNSQTLTP